MRRQAGGFNQTCGVPQVESMKHSHKLELANVKLECSRTTGEVERERDALQGQIDGRQQHAVNNAQVFWSVRISVKHSRFPSR